MVPQVERPRMDQVLAWRRGEAHSDDLPLLDAAAMMNCYSPTPIRVTGEGALGGLRVNGIFRTGDSASFARAMTALHGLVALERPDGLELVSGEGAVGAVDTGAAWRCRRRRAGRAAVSRGNQDPGGSRSSLPFWAANHRQIDMPE